MYTMDKKIVSLCVVLAFLSIFFLSLNTVYADGLHYTLTVRQNINVNSDYSKPKDNFTYVIEALTEDSPLPDGTKGGKYTFSLNGEEEKPLNIYYTEAGNYRYNIYQNRNDKVKYVTYDNKVYTLENKVIMTKKGLYIKPTMLNNENYKVENIEFTNSYNIPRDIISRSLGKLPKTGDETNGAMYISLILLSLAILILIYIKKDEEEIE